MKLLSATASLLIVSLLFACKKQPDPLDLPSVQPNNRLDTLVSMNATINGKSWKTDSVIAHNISYAIDSNKVNLLVTAIRVANDTTSTITFSITNFTDTGTYTISPPAVSAAYYVGTTRHYATSGQIVISSYANYSILGTVRFVADSITVANGVFNVQQP